MTDFRAHLERLDAADDLVEIARPTHWADTAAAVGAEATDANGPAVLLTDTGGAARCVSGALAGPDRLSVRSREPWSRIGSALGLGYDADYLTVLDALVAARGGDEDPNTAELAASETETDLRSLGIPAIGDTDVPVVTLGLAAVPAVQDGEATDVDAVRWLPVRGSVHGSDGLRLSVPAGALESTEEGSPLSLVLGAPPAALIGATMGWVGESHIAAPPRVAASLGTVPVAPTPAGAVPADSEIVVEAVVTGEARQPAGPRSPWEDAVATATINARVSRVSTRTDPVIPFSPTGAPMSDGRSLLSIIESARLYGRVNNYWGVTPVEWLAVPAEAGLGVCLVASDILYAGFEWQLANTLFSFSRLFDKVVVLDTETLPMDLGRAFDDIWVKAHPANDWEFSDPEAPPASATHYRQDGSTGSNVYVDAAWDPRWDEEYIAPRVTFETTYPAALRESVRTNWKSLGFDHGPEYEPERGNERRGMDAGSGDDA
ncbi:UbiD family decarboxylase domain-containing protein [Halobellus rufus]|uniref:UbiD family decarboxylase domain-containing protein n=1 Tax=Halobellus rufus TaxID=1448860 RepID=UPI000678826F|nr:UbiD family decarboxylase domain-containing protein [Halobellus rufus]